MKILAIDRGNSRTKAGIQASSGDLEVKIFASTASDELLDFVKKNSFDAAVMSSVSAESLANVAEYLQGQRNFLFVDPATPLPVKNAYATPKTLGTDRVAGAIGAWTLAGHKNILLIDAGTCINYECLADNTYWGGAISPGIRMRLKAMHEFTGKLPEVAIPEEEITFIIGNSTESCLQSGAIIGTVNEITATILRYERVYPGIHVILSGGDAPYLGKYLKNSIFATHKEAVLLGLIEILKHNLNVE